MNKSPPIHAAHCRCRYCGLQADRRRRRASTEWKIISAGLLLFWAFPGRWLLADLFHTLTR